MGIEPEKIKAPTRTAEETSGSKSVGTGEDIRRSGAGNAESNDKSLPEAFNTTVTQQEGEVNEKAVEKAGESVETGLRETYGLRQQSLSEKQRSVQRELESWKVSKGASETISRMVPDSVADLGRYTAAASSLYRLGQMEDVKTFDRALELADGSNALAVNTDYVLQQPGGREALQAAWLQGHGELEAGTVETGALGGALSDKSTRGEGRVIWKGSDRAADDVATQLIRLNAEGTGTDAVLRNVLRGPDGTPSERVRGYIDTETARIFFSDRNSDVFSTILHEDYHWYNALDGEGAAALQNQALEYLAESSGYENVDALIRAKVQDYAAQDLTYAQAAEELVADSWGGIFDSAESMTRWAQFQRQQADKNAGKAGTIAKAVNAVKQLLTNIISKAKEVLTRDPENRAALQAKRLAEAEKKALQDAYFAHAEKAMDMQRTMALVEDGMEIAGVPYGNGKKLVDAIRGYVQDMENAAKGEKFTFNSLPESATGQYDRLYNA